MKGYTLTEKSKKNIRVLKLFVISLIFVGIAASVAVIGCNYIVNRNFKENFYSVSSLKVNNKIRVVQISDLHNCSYGENNSRLVDRVKKLGPDIIIYTGDITDSGSQSDDVAVNLCAALADVAPSYYIYGNNEAEKYYDVLLTQDALDEKFGFNNENRKPSQLLEMTDELEVKLEEAGITVLKNESATLTVGTTLVDVYGVLTSNPSSFCSYAGESFDEYMFLNENNLKITAIHEPLVFTEYSLDSWGDLVLAGHTHGGIVNIPYIGPLYTRQAGILPERNGYYVNGRYEVQGRPLIVNTGLENTNIFRLNNKPEIVIVDINKF